MVAVAIAAPIQHIKEKKDAELLDKRAIDWANLIGLDSDTTTAGNQPNTVAAQAATTPVATAAAQPTTTKKSGFWADILGLGNTAGTATPTTAATQPSVQAAAAVTRTTAATPATTSGSQLLSGKSGFSGFLSSLLSLFKGDKSGSSGSSSSTSGASLSGNAGSSGSTTTPSSGTQTSGGWLSDILDIFKGGSSSASLIPTATPVTSTPAAETSTGIDGASSAPAQSSSTDQGSFGGLFGSPSSGNNGGASSTRAQPGFTEPVTVGGTGDGSSTGSQSSLSASLALSGQISKIATYAEKGGGITYSPYTKSGQCKTADEVASDMKMLSSYKLIRLYNVDCSGIQNVMQNLSPGQKAYLGVWSIDNLNNDLGSLKQQVLSSSSGWSGVHTVAIGNELVNAGTKTPSQILDAVNEARSWFKSNAPSYKGYIVSVDTLAAVMKDKLMCDISDYLAVNCHPYFSGIEASTSGTWLKQQVNQLKSWCNNGKDVLVTESGWPTFGNTVGDSVPSISNQYLAVQSLGNVMGDSVIMFTTFNDYWKNPGSYNVEQHWGIYGDPSI